jgi:hypothetical protein
LSQRITTPPLTPGRQNWQPECLTATPAGDIERIAGSEAFRSKPEPLGVIPTALGGQLFPGFSVPNWPNGPRP